jgi:hypothetical protein
MWNTEDTLPDLRVTIAESMYALALRIATTPESENDRAMRLINGANTLRWCAAREAPSVEELLAEVKLLTEAVEEAEDNVADLVANVGLAASKWEHAQACQADDAPCSCALAERRKSVLDAVA